MLQASEEQCCEALEQLASKRPEPIVHAAPFAMASMRPEPKRPEPIVNAVPMLPILQFSCPKYFCAEEEDTVQLKVMRLHSGSATSHVRYRTKDGTAEAGKAYEAQSGELEFGPNEKEQEIRIKLIDDVRWGGITEFQVVLEEEGLQKAMLSSYLSTARVQRIDDDTFPSNRYREEILERRLEDIDGNSLLREYFQYNFNDPTIFWGTLKLLLLGQIVNMNYIVGLFASVFLVDRVLVADFQPHGFFSDQKTALTALVLLNLLPLVVLHVLDFSKYSWKVSGRARSIATGGLMNAFLNYSDTSRTEIDAGALVEAMTTDTDMVIKMGYSNFLTIFQLIGQIVMCTCFQAAAPLAFGGETRILTIVQMILYPIATGLALACRLNVTKRALNARMASKRKFVKHVNDTVACFRLVADFNQRFHVQDVHEANTVDCNNSDRGVNQVLCNNLYLVKWLTAFSIGVYTLLGGLSVIREQNGEGGIRLGVFLTTLRVVVAVGSLWNQVFKTMLETLQSLPALIRIVDFTNLPGDSRDRMIWSQKSAHDMATEMNKSPLLAGSSVDITQLPTAPRRNRVSCFETGISTVDHLDIKVNNLVMSLQAKGMDREDLGLVVRETNMLFDNLSIRQGQLVAFVGKTGKGKTTLLRVLGGASLPNARDNAKSQCFVPSHLRVLHVPSETMFLRGTLYENLTFGVVDKNHPDGKVSRVQKICRRLGISGELLEMVHPDDRTEICWAESLSSTEQHLIAIARALIANPEILCIHKPMLHVGASAAQSVIELLREFVDKRGVEQDENEYRLRRPRTCIMTSTRAKSLSVVDSVFKVHAVEEGTTKPHIQAIDKDKVALEVSLDDLC